MPYIFSVMQKVVNIWITCQPLIPVASLPQSSGAVPSLLSYRIQLAAQSCCRWAPSMASCRLARSVSCSRTRGFRRRRPTTNQQTRTGSPRCTISRGTRTNRPRPTLPARGASWTAFLFTAEEGLDAVREKAGHCTAGFRQTGNRSQGPAYYSAILQVSAFMLYVCTTWCGSSLSPTVIYLWISLSLDIRRPPLVGGHQAAKIKLHPVISILYVP